MKYRIELTEQQMRVLRNALEEYFRLRMGQDSDFTDDMACINSEHLDQKLVFDRMIQRRNHMHDVIKAFFMIAYEPTGYLLKKTNDMLIAEDIWEAVRYAKGEGRFNSPMFVGPEPFPKIEKVEDEGNDH